MSTDDDYELRLRISHTEKRLSFVEELAGIGYVEMDIKKRRIDASPEIGKILGYDSETLSSLFLKQLLSPKDYQKFIKSLVSLYHQKCAVKGEFRLKTADGSAKFCLWHASYFKIDGREIMAGTIQDLNELIVLNKQLKAARLNAEKSNKEKSVFLAQASHDLRQPMMALSLYIDLFQTKGLNEVQYDIWHKISRSAQNLRCLLDNFLDLSKLEYGSVKISPKILNTALLLDALGKEFADLAECHNLNFEYTICHCKIYSDQFMLERILRNLLSNAFKFARHKVGFYCRENENSVELIISDDGKGMSDEEQKKIFKEFYRGQNEINRRIDGAGLGLAIVQKLAKLLKIKIDVQSEIEKGSVFCVTLPKQKSQL